MKPTAYDLLKNLRLQSPNLIVEKCSVEWIDEWAHQALPCRVLVAGFTGGFPKMYHQGEIVLVNIDQHGEPFTVKQENEQGHTMKTFYRVNARDVIGAIVEPPKEPSTP